MAFDLLYWNSDSTRMPAAMHSFYLRNMYLYNRLREPGRISLDGCANRPAPDSDAGLLDFHREDHIVPWRTTYLGTQLLAGPKRFVLGGSGPLPVLLTRRRPTKYGYCTTRARPTLQKNGWKALHCHEGSWWLDWAKWVEPFNGNWLPPASPAMATTGAGRCARAVMLRHAG